MKFLQFVAQMLRAARGDVISRARGQSRRRSLPSAALRKIDIFFDERPAHSKEYRTIVAFSRFRFHSQLSAINFPCTSTIGRSIFSNAARLGECRSPSYFRTLEQNRDVPSFRCRRTIAERARAIVEQPSQRFFDRLGRE